MIVLKMQCLDFNGKHLLSYLKITLWGLGEWLNQLILTI